MSKKTAKTTKKENEVMITITAPTDIVDGYYEAILGILAFTNILKARAGACKQKVDDHNTMITEFFKMSDPPLGSQGLGDIPDCDDK